MDDDTSPNCPQCLTPLVVAGTEKHPYWYCPQCKVARLN